MLSRVLARKAVRIYGLAGYRLENCRFGLPGTRLQGDSSDRDEGLEAKIRRSRRKKIQFLSLDAVAAWATWVVFFLGAVREREEADSGSPPCV
jgi:hypothetical protein